MADYLPLKGEDGEEEEQSKPKPRTRTNTRLASLDVFRGLAVFLMIFVDYGGSVFPFIAHSPWNGVHLADFVMPFFLFIAGVSLSLVHKNVSNKVLATRKVVLRAAALFLLGILLQGGYLHGLNSLTFGVDIERIRWFGILQRISIGYILAALCEIWLSRRQREVGLFKSYYLHWCLALLLSTIYLGLLYGLYVPDWKFKLSESTSFVSFSNDHDIVYTVKCAVRGNLGPACNSAGMIDRYVLGTDHLYRKPVYRNLKECGSSKNGQVSDSSPSWCHAPFDPEGILRLAYMDPLVEQGNKVYLSECTSDSFAAVTCIIGLHYGHVLVQLEDHKDRLIQWLLSSVSLFFIGLFLTFTGIPLNKPLYTISYMLLTSGTAGITFCALYLLVDVGGYKHLTCLLEWIGKHSLSIFVLVTSNLVVIAIQGFYWKSPENNIINWIVMHVKSLGEQLPCPLGWCPAVECWHTRGDGFDSSIFTLCLKDCLFIGYSMYSYVQYKK